MFDKCYNTTMSIHTLKRFFIIGFKLFFLGLLLFVIAAVGVYAYYSKDLPEPGHITERRVSESTKIFDRTGQVLLYEIHGEEKRTIIPFEQMPGQIKQATVAIEDDKFYEHHGLDFKAILRAILADILNRSKSQGASTITQQFIKNSVLSNEKTYSRKIKEAILSIELERRFSKDDILGMYLNEIPYGSNAYGIEAASQTFFGRSAGELSLDECALLASLPKAPTYYSPYGDHRDELVWRKEWVLKRLEDQGYISSEQGKEAAAIDTLAKIRPPAESIKAPHFVMYVKQQLVEKYGNELVESGGLRIYTTLDWRMQVAAEEILRNRAEKNQKLFDAQNAALVALDPKTGDILCMVGSIDYFDKAADGNVNVAIRMRQPGSSFKPFVYATAFAKGYLPETILLDAKTNFGNYGGQDYVPNNYNGTFMGPVPMKNALAMSLNVPAVETLYLAGINESIDTAEAMGITTLKDRSRYGLALVLGGGEVTLLDEASAFGVFANDGRKKDKTAISRIEDSKGSIVEEKSLDPGQQVLVPQIARQINDCLSDNTARSPVFGSHSALYISGKNVAVKTGTTQDYRDAWTIGYTPELVVGVWAGKNNGSSMRPGADGSVVAAPIWNDFMSRFIAERSSEDFIKPGKITIDKPMLGGYLEDKVTIKIDKASDLVATDDCSKKHTEERTFYKVHSILYYLDKDDPLGPIPQHPETDPQFENWEKAAQSWAKENKIKDSPPEDKGCKGKKKD